MLLTQANTIQSVLKATKYIVLRYYPRNINIDSLICLILKKILFT